MPRVLPILSRLLRRRKNIHWSPLLHHDTTFPVPRRTRPYSTRNVQPVSCLLFLRRLPRPSFPTIPMRRPTHFIRDQRRWAWSRWEVTAARPAAGVARDSSSFSATFHRHHCQSRPLDSSDPPIGRGRGLDPLTPDSASSRSTPTGLFL